MITLAKNILASINNNIYNFKELNESELMKINGIGKSKAVTLMALVELVIGFIILIKMLEHQ